MPPAFNEQAVIEEVRTRLGSLDEEELKETVIKKALTAALRQFSRYKPGLLETTIQIQESVSDYDLPGQTIGLEALAINSFWSIQQEFMDPTMVPRPDMFFDFYDQRYQ